MSVEIILIPLAIAAVASWQTSRAETDSRGTIRYNVGTRMRNVNLLRASLADAGATVRAHDDLLVADWEGVQATFSRDAAGIWTAHYAGNVDEARALEITAAIDQRYGHRVQQSVLDQLRSRAAQADIEIESETTHEDATVTVVLALQGRQT